MASQTKRQLHDNTNNMTTHTIKQTCGKQMKRQTTTNIHMIRQEQKNKASKTHATTNKWRDK